MLYSGNINLTRQPSPFLFLKSVIFIGHQHPGLLCEGLVLASIQKPSQSAHQLATSNCPPSPSPPVLAGLHLNQETQALSHVDQIDVIVSAH